MPSQEDWTLNPDAAVQHIKGLPASDRERILALYRIMMRGEDGGQIEPWGPSIREIVYPEWTDDDFTLVVRALSSDPNTADGGFTWWT